MTVEDLLESIAGPYAKHKIQLEHSDIGIMSSIARQTKRNIGLTDRQLALVKNKLDLYKDQIPDYVDTNELRIPLREIDRRQYVAVETLEDKKYIVIKFPFKKKLIDLVDAVRRLSPEKHKRAEDKQKHYFLLSESTIYNVVGLALKFPAFDIEKQLLDWYQELENIAQNTKDYIPYVQQDKVYNLSDNASKALVEHCGNSDSLLFYDRRYLFGLESFDNDEINSKMSHVSVLTQKLIRRKTDDIFIDNKEWTMNQLANSLHELNRYPILVVLNPKVALDELILVHNAFNGFIDNKDCSVMFRLDNNDEGTEFNNYIREKNLNNSVALNTKIVYTSKEKIPKPLIESGFRHTCMVTMNTFRHNNKINLFNEGNDLTIVYSSDESMISRYYNKRQKL